MKPYRFLTLFIFVPCISFSAIGQKAKVISDFRAIQEASVVKSFDGKWDVELGAKAILEKDISRLGEFDLNAGLSYEPWKYLTLGIGYQFSENKTGSGDYAIRHRFEGSAETGVKWHRFKAEYRIQYQNTDDELFHSDDAYVAKNILRNRLELKYNISKCKLSPYITAEHYGQLDKGVDYGLKMKFAIGTNYDFSKHHALKIYYRLDRELNALHPYTYHNLGIAYKYKF